MPSMTGAVPRLKINSYVQLQLAKHVRCAVAHVIQVAGRACLMHPINLFHRALNPKKGHGAPCSCLMIPSWNLRSVCVVLTVADCCVCACAGS